MIPVVQQPEPGDFATKVRQPGNRFLQTNPWPSASQFKKKRYWKDALPQLHSAYGEVCAYSSIWISMTRSVDHFLPKTVYPHLAYEWSNFRLAMDRINSNKGESEDVLDPFTIQEGWFVLDLASVFVQPGPALPQKIRDQVQKSIDILKLNDDILVSMRFRVLRDYIDGDISLRHIGRYYPFIAVEIKRQGIQPSKQP